MDRESHAPRHTPTWPPGMPVGTARSVVLEHDGGWQDIQSNLHDAAGFVRRHGREGSTVLALVICAFSFGFSLTDWFCDFDCQAALSATVGAVGITRQKPIHRRAEPVARAEESARTGAMHVEALEEYPPMIVGLQAPQPWASAAITRVTPKRAPRISHRSKPVAAVEAAAAVDELSGLDRLSLMQDDAPAPRAESVRNEVWPTDGAWLRDGARKPEKDESPVVHEVAPPKPRVRAVEIEAPPPAAAGHKVAAIEALYVEGGLPQGVVSRGVSRLLPQYERCSEFCDGETQRLKLSTVIDEAGHGRRIVVEGESQPGLRRCLEQATAHLAVPAPDTGTARARWIVRFANE